MVAGEVCSLCLLTRSLASRSPRLSHGAPIAVQTDWSNNALRRVNLSSGLVTTLAGNYALSTGPPNNFGNADGVGNASSFYNPTGIAMDAAGTVAIIVRGLMGEDIKAVA